MVKLGTYAEIMLATSQPRRSWAFYQPLGFREVREGVLTDGSINLRLEPGEFLSPTLRYAGSDIERIAALFRKDKRKRTEKRTGQAEFRDPSGRVRIQLQHRKSATPMPAGTPTSRKPISRLGQFGEFTIPVRSLPEALFFWTKLGYEPLHMAQIPYHYAILSDGLMVIGLHESKQPRVTLTYFAPDMADRIAALRADGVDVQPVGPGQGGEGSGSLISPEGMMFYLFTGEV